MPVVYRHLEMTRDPLFFAIPYKDKLVLFYGDAKENIRSEKPTGDDETYSFYSVVLAQAVIGSNAGIS